MIAEPHACTYPARTTSSHSRSPSVMSTRAPRVPCRSLRPSTVSAQILLHIAPPLITACQIFLDADIVCSRAKNHYDPAGNSFDMSETATQMDQCQADNSLATYKSGFKPLHKNQSFLMYFSVSTGNERRGCVKTDWCR